MRFSTSAAVFTLLSYAASVQAIYFTYPQASTVWTTAFGQTMTWHYQAGDAIVGTFLLYSADESHYISLGTQIQLQTESLAFPSKIALTSTTKTYVGVFVR
ncbi:hypothetical protein MNV49_005862 [Pseudohyphozyma bogoriensis]|nr:hypothetical protein MNV49_005862 [Pseudohyphozyma bogoriensis]